MAILSKRITNEVSKTYYKVYGLRPYFVDLSCKAVNRNDDLSVLSNTHRRRDYALQESINLGEPYIFFPAPAVATWVVGMEDRRMVHGGLIGGEVLVDGRSPSPPEKSQESINYLVSHGMTRESAEKFLSRLPVWPEPRIREAAQFLQKTFYQISGWKPELMEENRLKLLQRQMMNQAIEDQKKRGEEALYAFEKERVLLANIRVGDKNEARRILNEMLATIYMSSPQLVVLRARVIELISCLTRAAIEDNPLMEPLIEQNHAWTERLVRAQSFEDLSHVLMDALDDFIEGIYLHGVNRSNIKVQKALDYIGRNFIKRITLQEVANEVGLSPCRLSHLVKEFTGRTVLQIIHQMRIRHAQYLLERTSKSCTEIAYEVGFSDQSYFIKHFKRLTGRTPARYRSRFRTS